MNQIEDIIHNSIEIKKEILANQHLLKRISDASNKIYEAFLQGNKILFCGNGGSAADAQHLASEFTGRFYLDRRALPAEALHTNTSYLTAVANDFSFDVIYSRLIEGIGDEGDILVAMSTSGNSLNILNALDAAKQKGMVTIGFTGSTGGQMKEKADILINIPSDDTPRIQECHIMIGHIICQIVEESMFER